jgi:hypothetical protein
VKKSRIRSRYAAAKSACGAGEEPLLAVSQTDGRSDDSAAVAIVCFVASSIIELVENSVYFHILWLDNPGIKWPSLLDLPDTLPALPR